MIESFRTRRENLRRWRTTATPGALGATDPKKMGEGRARSCSSARRTNRPQANYSPARAERRRTSGPPKAGVRASPATLHCRFRDGFQSHDRLTVRSGGHPRSRRQGAGRWIESLLHPAALYLHTDMGMPPKVMTIPGDSPRSRFRRLGWLVDHPLQVGVSYPLQTDLYGFLEGQARDHPRYCGV